MSNTISRPWYLCCFLFNAPHIVNKLGKRIFYQTILSCLEQFCSREMVTTNSMTILPKGPCGFVQYNTPLKKALAGKPTENRIIH